MRTSALLLFLVQLPQSDQARRRRQERLAGGDSDGVARIWSKQGGSAPGNCVVADLGELRTLREAVLAGEIPDEMADEFAIPPEAISALPDPVAFTAVRERWLATREKEFIETFGLVVGGIE